MSGTEIEPVGPDRTPGFQHRPLAEFARIQLARYETLKQECDALLRACKAARGTPEQQGLFDLGVGACNEELDQSYSPGAAALRARAGEIHRQIDEAIAGIPEEEQS